MTRIDQDDGCAYLTGNETWRVTIRATIEVDVVIGGLSDRQLDRLDNAQVLEALEDAGIEDANIKSWEIEDQEVEE